MLRNSTVIGVFIRQKRKEEREEDALSGHWRCMPQDGRQGHQRCSAFEDLRDTPGYAPFSVAALSPTDELELYLSSPDAFPLKGT